ncbi:MAG TPA: type II toxin-antitoxin system HicB family antitoxin [bacterium]|jgi:predicted RNase H-like HicB family nuclease|nr:type II toxin-antitoxin system HicB family antitoxin [bacterium]
MSPKLKVVIHKAKSPDVAYWAEIAGMPGCITEDDTLQELHANLREAVQGWLLAQLPSKSVAKPAELKRFTARASVWQGDTKRELVAAF